MGQFALCKVCFTSWALVLMGAAERLFFLQNNSLTWAEARSYCQLCFKDLVTVTPNNTYIIAHNLSSDYWVGLRKNSFPFSNSSSNSSSSPGVAWTHWANGDPLAFQNWYPGWPKFKPVLPEISCCSCACTCPAVTTPRSTAVTSYPMSDATYYDATAKDSANGSYFNTTDFLNLNLNQATSSSQFVSVPPTHPLPVEAACEKKPMSLPQLPEPERDYMEDSCVAMLRSGAWVERNCTDLLPFICYDDRFYGAVSFTNVTASSVVLTWLPVPGELDYHRLQVTNSAGDEVLMVNLSLSLTFNVMNLLAGSKYNVAVFTSKCDRDVDNPQRVSFYTIPNKVENLTFTVQTPISITLSWSKPEGSMDFYLVQYNGMSVRTTTEGIQVTGLTPGTLYAFTILSGVNDTSKWSDSSNISVYTRPSEVSNLSVYNHSDTSLSLNWTKPPGGFTGYRVTCSPQSNPPPVVDDSNAILTVSGLPPGTQVTINVTVLVNGSLEGETVSLSIFTDPPPVSNLTLSSSDGAINASWSYPPGALFSFVVVLQSVDGRNSSYNTTSTSIGLKGLNAAANYTVYVSSVTTNASSTPVSSSIFTLPTPPTNPRVTFKNTRQINFQWDAPANTGTVTYRVNLVSMYWNQNQTFEVMDQTSYTFTNLTSGTYYDFTVRTLAGNLQSDPAITSNMTDPQPVHLSLALMCSSATPLSCGTDQTKGSIFVQLQNILAQNFKGVFWVLNNRTSENLAP